MRQQTPLAVHEANIQSASVEIKIITVGGKQMTLAVFRQLPEVALVDWQTTILEGWPWGVVNYHNACGDGAHLHVVWQDGGELRKSAFYREGYKEHSRNVRFACEAMITYMAIELAMEEEPFLVKGDARPIGDGYVYIGDYERVSLKFQRYTLIVGGDLASVIAKLWNARRLESSRFQTEEAIKKKQGEVEVSLKFRRKDAITAFEELGPALGVDEVWQLYQEWQAWSTSIGEEWLAIYERLAKLDQLFIAV